MTAPATQPSTWALKLARRWHTWLGLATALNLAILSISGIYLNHRDLFSPDREAQRMQDPSSVPEALTTTAAGRVLDPSRALAHARALWGPVRLEQMQLRQQGPGLAWQLRGEDGREIRVDASSGVLLGQRGPRAGGALAHVMWGLHTGAILSLPGRLLADAVALGILVLTGSGLYLYLSPRRIKARKARERALLEPERMRHVPVPSPCQLPLE